MFIAVDTNIAANAEPGVQTEDFAQRVRVDQTKLASELRPHYDFIVCGLGSSGLVVTRRLAEDSDVSLLLLEAGGSDDCCQRQGGRSMACQSWKRSGLDLPRSSKAEVHYAEKAWQRKERGYWADQNGR